MVTAMILKAFTVKYGAQLIRAPPIRLMQAVLSAIFLLPSRIML
jgi:hypothetical protein